MGEYTLASVRSEVRQRGDFPLSRKFDNPYVDREIQKSWTATHRIVEEVNEGFFDKEDTVTTTASVAYVALPADARKIKGVDILTGGEYEPLDQVQLSDRNRFGATNDEPRAYRLSERGAELYPTPNTAYTLRVTYARKVASLSGTPVEIDDDWIEYVIWCAITKIATTQERSTTQYEQRMAEAEMAIRGGSARRRQAEPEYLVLREYSDGW